MNETQQAAWPVQRRDDPEMHDAIVTGIAQYILRGWSHHTRPVPTEAQVAAVTRQELAEAAAYGYTFTQDAGHFAAAAQEFALRKRDTDPHWAGWAFGH